MGGRIRGASNRFLLALRWPCPGGARPGPPSAATATPYFRRIFRSAPTSAATWSGVVPGSMDTRITDRASASV